MKIKRWQRKISRFQEAQPQALLWINCVLGSLFLHGLGFLLFFMLLTLDDSPKNKLANLIKIPIDFITLKTPIISPKSPVKNVENLPEKPTLTDNKTEQNQNNKTTNKTQNPNEKNTSTEINTVKNINQNNINQIYTNNISKPNLKRYEISSVPIKSTLFTRKINQNQAEVNPIKTNNYPLETPPNPVIKNQFNRYNSFNNWDNKRNTSRENLNQFTPIAPPANRILPPIDTKKSNNIVTNNINNEIISTENNAMPSITVPTIKVERLVATVISYSSSNENTNIPDIPAKPLTKQTEISSPSLNSSTATLEMTLLVNTQGTATVQSATLIDGISTTNSQQLASEITQKWQFKPATQEGQSVDSLLKMTIRVRKR